MGSRKAMYVDYQARALAFKVGDRVYPFLGGNPANSGTVVAVWPAIGMVDLQFSHGSARYPVEDLVFSPEQNPRERDVALKYDSVPGGAGTVSVPGGPDKSLKSEGGEAVIVAPVKASVSEKSDARKGVTESFPVAVPNRVTEKSAVEKASTVKAVTPKESPKGSRVASAYFKKAIYWFSPDRKYRLTKEEAASGRICCPRCDENYLTRASYKRELGKSVRLWVCRDCLFIIRDCDIEGMGV